MTSRTSAATRPCSRKEIHRKIEVWQRRLELDRWHIFVDWDRYPYDDGIAEVNANTSPYAQACLIFHREVTSWPRDSWGDAGVKSADYAICHELLHIVLRDVDRALSRVQFQIHRDAYAIAEDAHSDAMEGAIDRLAHVLLDAFGPA